MESKYYITYIPWKRSQLISNQTLIIIKVVYLIKKIIYNNVSNFIVFALDIMDFDFLIFT